MLREENEKNMHSMGMGSKVLFKLFGMQDIYISGFANLPKLLRYYIPRSYTTTLDITP